MGEQTVHCINNQFVRTAARAGRKTQQLLGLTLGKLKFHS